MLTVAYLANQFPAPVEPYVGEEIQELRRRGVRVIAGSVRRPNAANLAANANVGWESLCIEPVRFLILARALLLAVRRWKRISRLLGRALLRGKETPRLRLKALLQTWLGAYYAVLLQETGVDHIHVHHGYFGSWIGMVAAQLLGTSFSMTLHGSDLLVHRVYLDTKLSHCRFCITISEYNRRYILQHFPAIDPKIIILSRLGVDPKPSRFARKSIGAKRPNFTLLTAGRLHAVKKHPFLVHACARIRDNKLDFKCAIAGEGKERQHNEYIGKEH
jgi:colanic acid/amylovoran biosynthesis glycosyltransferase